MTKTELELRQALEDLVRYTDELLPDDYTPNVMKRARALLAAQPSPQAVEPDARKRVIEECAKVCDAYPNRDPGEDGNGYWAAAECARAIRALAEDKP